MKQLDLSIIIVNYNTRDFLAACLRSLRESISQELSYEVIVVDNASHDDSVDMLRREFPWVTTIANKENSGFAKANNIGIKKSSGRYVLFLNSDTVVSKEVLEEMVEFMDKYPRAGAATCYLKLEDGTMDDASHRGFPTPTNAFFHFSGLSKVFPHTKLFSGYSMGYANMTKIHEIDALAGAFMLTRREAGEEVGWWDDDYFFYGEDIDFCYRLKEKGWKIYFVPSISILHYKGVSHGMKKHTQDKTTADAETRTRSTYARFNAMKIFYNKHYVKKYPKWLTRLVMEGIDMKQKRALKEIS